MLAHRVARLPARFGEALALIDTAEFAVLVGRRATTWTAAAGGPRPARTSGAGRCARLRGYVTSGATDRPASLMMFDTGGSTTRSDSTLLRYYRDAAMFRTHIAAQYDAVWLSTGRAWFGGELSH